MNVSKTPRNIENIILQGFAAAAIAFIATKIVLSFA